MALNPAGAAIAEPPVCRRSTFLKSQIAVPEHGILEALTALHPVLTAFCTSSCIAMRVLMLVHAAQRVIHHQKSAPLT
jgi:hypothetical protein